MESHDIFPDDVHIRRPPSRLIILDDSEVVEECVIPDIRDLTGVKRERYAESIGLSRDRKILESTSNELADLMVSTPGLHEIRMILIELQYLILIFRESEKIILLLQVFERLVRMVSALPFDEITLLLECFTADTVESLVDSLIDISGII